MGVRLDGPVGRRFHRQNVENKASDQDKVIEMLSKISKADGGKMEVWNKLQTSGPNGTCPDPVEEAIWDFQEHWKKLGHFHNIDGVVDKDMNTLAYLNLLAAGQRPPGPSAPSPFVQPAKQNPRILLDGTQAVERDPPMHPLDWIKRTQSTLDTICRTPVGLQVVQRIQQLFIVVHTTSDPNAGASRVGTNEVLTFTAEDFDNELGPGAGPDEILLHEMIHVAEGHFGRYDNGGTLLAGDEPFLYARAEFLAVIGTNVYSSGLGRGVAGLRKDHAFHLPMPEPYASTPSEHVARFRANYVKAQNNNSGLFSVFRNASAPWNPFKLFTS